MEKITVKNRDGYVQTITVDSYGDVSDGYHTIEELYDHRITLYIALCRELQRPGTWVGETLTPEKPVWRSKLHHDSTGYDGWFMLAIGKEPGKQITYHIPLSRWNETDFAETFEKAPVPFDGHTSADVLERLKAL